MRHDEGLSINATNFSRDTALIYAAKKSRTDACLSLLRKGADKSARDYEGKTAADSARAAGNDSLAQLIDQFRPPLDPASHFNFGALSWPDTPKPRGVRDVYPESQ